MHVRSKSSKILSMWESVDSLVQFLIKKIIVAIRYIVNSLFFSNFNDFLKHNNNNCYNKQVHFDCARILLSQKEWFIILSTEKSNRKKRNFVAIKYFWDIHMC